MKLNFAKLGSVVPVVIQEKKSGQILMVGFMNKEAVSASIRSGYVVFWSRERKALWKKGETSGNQFRLLEITADCDRDSLLIQVKLVGVGACHLGFRSCFRNKL
ncbi:MAG: phosphoribosyl-AMP cyclohydrolase, phosphoribosyl-ATP pyrophosphohydrolase / phosphoribosyl-AMP cyclohydrolase [Candidatus Gottesmanbacteria bacterium GW2011_GWA2_43_14]|uniref:Histidine biosynthesis bifunctional protein HisIE n=1 Tax=Candidatus Gottesmanbacteria bacterium GW2011_GWA2_43_14 TaxID=1618443 RepID=A0A0G1GCM9_9BACT|nr:MAG: phosphoribosyl-AMP cyclohydrolase, phosphoribosyl-ATP pyrophosphohydrolase / phosphoribosyl-AMP cyclohydrolase [Candidatus Gottesmanbacteria bacterium GW2011_GWA2_43_14]